MVAGTMTNRDKTAIIKQLVRASDATHEAFRIAAHANDLDTAKCLREQVKSIGASIARISGPPPLPSLDEALS